MKFMSPSHRPTSRTFYVPVKIPYRGRITPDAPGGIGGSPRSVGSRGPGNVVLASGTFGIPLGSGDRRDRGRIGAMPGIFEIYDDVAGRREAALLRKTVRRNVPPNKVVIPKVTKVLLAPPGGDLVDLRSNPYGIPKMGERKMGLDLGDLLGSLGGKYIDARYGTPGPAGGVWRDVAGPPAWNTPGAFAEGGAIPATPADVPFVDVIPEAKQKGLCWDPAGNCGAGKWVRKYRRRRKRLATASDIKDLASLSSVTTPAEKKTWIATHPS